MIKIKDYIFNEVKILEIKENDQENELIVYYDTNNHDRVLRYIENATLEDIEWDYGNNISESLSYDLAKARIEELEEKNKKLKEDYDMLDKFDDKNIDDYEKLEEENKKLNELVQFNVKTTITLTERINKAIDYIIERYDYKGHALTHTFDKDNVRELLEILEKNKYE